MTNDATSSHDSAAAEFNRDRTIGCGVLTLSDSRDIDTDQSGGRIINMLVQAGHVLVERVVIKDDPETLRAQLDGWIANPAIHVALLTGGTGVSRRDQTVGVVESLFEKRIDGFGELFRIMSFREIGSKSMLSNATAGLVVRDADAGGDTFIFAMPGSTAAVELAMRRLILPELPHLLWQRST